MSSIKALVVDDSKSARFSLRKMLKQYDVEADIVESGAEALEFLRNAEHAPCVIFMDHMMPDMDGFETTRAIIADEGIGEIPIIMCTSNEGEDYLAEAKGIGAHGTISKPPTPEGLKAVIDNLECEQEEAAAPAEAVAAISSDQLESLVQAAVAKALDERIDAITHSVLEKAEARSRELVSEHLGQESARIQDETLIACNTQLQELREEVLTVSKEQTTDLIKSELEGHIGEAINSGLDSLQAKAKETEKAWLADQDRLRTTLNESARQTAQTVMAGAGDEARKIATEVAEQAMRSVDNASAEQAAGQARMMAIAAGVVGVIAAAIVYFIK
jgi:CheY-like chemotaxis protein